mmetsp:Transcript_11529/g.26609  ORF Transcript_11529/g.26609 Transcript_11529/m.26609 type:complete len:304 (-) Transcript_11529:82-993(-)
MLPIGFVGLGNMGARMARHLLRAGHCVVAFDSNDERLVQLQREGAQMAHSAADVSARLAAQSAEATLITMLPGNEQVRDAFTTDRIGILAGARPGLQLIDCSTVAPAVSREMHAAARERECDFVDAPVSGGVVGAEAASLTFMVGAANGASVARATPVLELMGKRVLHCGGVGSGQAAKLANNLVLAVSMLGVAEGMLLGQRLGVDKKVLASVFDSSSARCWASDTYNPCPGVLDGVPSSREYEGGFAVDLMRKDLRLALGAAPLPTVRTARAALAAYDAASGAGHGSKDFSVVYRLLDELPE